MRVDDYVGLGDRSGRRIIKDPSAASIAAAGEGGVILGCVRNRDQAYAIAAC